MTSSPPAPSRTKSPTRAFQRFIEDPDAGLFKGPWVQLKRPFRPASVGIDPPFDIQAPFHPFVHQYRAWRRLSAKDQSPQNTIVTTGTGLGKTECFLIPILDHCRRAKKEGQRKGQGKRFADTIWKNAQLKAAGIRIGNYTGRYDPAAPQASMRGTVAAKAANSLIIIKKMITILKLNLHASRNPDRILWETGEL